MNKPLFQHKPHYYKPRNVNADHQAEQQGFNIRLAIWLTRNVGTMACAYAFTVIGCMCLFGAFTNNTVLVAIFGSISSYLLQLVLLPVILVGSNTLNRKQELQAEEDFQVNQKSFHDIEQIMEHLNAQDQESLKQRELIEKLMRQINAATGRGAA